MPMKLASLFCDHMVLQRDMPLPIWGWDEPDKQVTVEVAGVSATAVTDNDGAWRTTLPSLSAGGPYEMVISGSESITLHDVLVGEVWLCSGQSNMEWTVILSDNHEEEIAAANYPDIRLFTVPKVAATEKLTTIENACWSVCTPETIPNFSAVAYYFGRELHKELNIPVGLINSSWGGTQAESWTSREGLLSFPEISDIVAKYEENLPQMEKLMAEYNVDLALWEQNLPKDPGNSGLSSGWADMATDTYSWDQMEIPQPWLNAGVDPHGILWFRREVDIPADWAGKELTLHLGAIDKSDFTYFNGVEVGAMDYFTNPDTWEILREYTVPGELVKAGRNVIAVRAFSHVYSGGMLGPANEMRLCGDGEDIPLSGTWRYAVEQNFGKSPDPPLMPIGPGNPAAPYTLFDGMIAPLIPFVLRGVIWYQGESNAERAMQYRTLFPALIRDWRRQWQQDDFPFLFVQLANYNNTPPKKEPAESDWAELREAQSMTLREPNTGMVVAIDIGDPIDIHPKNKQEVGRRLALNALALVYGKSDVIYSGPLYREMRVEGDSIRIFFDHVAGGLLARGSELKGFAIAGADRRFVWADAVIDGDTVLVSSPQVAKPLAVRYAWTDNPTCNLYNQANLPASPFRTDGWDRTGE